VKWLSADALVPSTYAHLLPGCTAVVHTLGTLLEDSNYKTSIKSGDIGGLISSIIGSVTGSSVGGSNPLERRSGGTEGSYERLNRDAALRVCETFASVGQGVSSDVTARRTFVYLSAEDIFRPIVPTRYIETKRQAERGISEILWDHPDVRAAYIRPSLVYHSHFRPLTTPVATLLDLSATLHRSAPAGIPTPSSVLRALGAAVTPPPPSSADLDMQPSALSSIANALTVPPIHVDHVAEAICKVVLDDTVEGVVDVKRMRELIGWSSEETGRLDAHTV